MCKKIQKTGMTPGLYKINNYRRLVYGEVISCYFFHICHSRPSFIKWRIDLVRGVGTIVAVIVWQLDLQLPMSLVPIITNAVSLNPAQVGCTRNMYNFVSDLRQVGGFRPLYLLNFIYLFFYILANCSNPSWYCTNDWRLRRCCHGNDGLCTSFIER